MMRFATHAMALAMLVAAPALAATNPMVGGAAMFANRTIVDNAVNSKDHTTLVVAVQAAGLVPTLQGPGPFTVFAPTNAAFAALPAGTVDTLLQPAMKPQLRGVLTYHEVPGKRSAGELMAMARRTGGKARLTTVAGGTLEVTTDGRRLMLTDAAGATSSITIADVNQSNGVIHVVDRVRMP